ncbi:MAG: InlB B-repeat-containing protein [Bacteroidales bacterium]|nr:InlB B-repeat-containing protein [Bacteroidales bacterium]
MRNKFLSLLLLITTMLMSGTTLWAQTYDVVYGEGPGSMYFKVHPSDDPDARYAEMVEGPYQYSGIVAVPDNVEKDDIVYPVTTIAYKCFANCKLLKQVILGSNVKTIKSQAFFYSGDSSGLMDYKGTKRNGIIVNLDAPSLTTIEANAFYVTSITPEDGVLRIGKNVASIGDNSTTLFGWASFYGNKVEVAEGNTNYVVDAKGILYDKNITKLVLFPVLAGKIDYTTPTTLKRFLSHSMNMTLNSFTDGGGLEYVGSNGWGSTTNISLGKKVAGFGDYYRITGADKCNLTVDPENPKYRVITDANGNRALYELNTGGVPYKLLKAFQTDGKSGTYGSDTFILPTTVTHIVSLAFYSCTSLKYVDCQNSEVLLAENIDNSAAPAPVAIKYINISLYKELEGQEGIEYTKDMKKLVSWSSNAEVVDYVMPNEVTSIAGSGMHDNQIAKTFDIGQNLKLDGNDGYFYRLQNLEKFTASNGNKNGLFVYDDALYKRETGKISMISYPRGRKKMLYTVADGTQYLSGNTGTPSVRTFYGTKLRAIDLGDDMKEIRHYSMQNMTNLSVVRLASPTPPVAASSSFSGTASAANQKILCVPKELMDIYAENSVFNTCFKLFVEEDKYEEYVRMIEVEYDIEHFKQNLDDDEYASTRQPKVKGNLLSETKASNYVFTGELIRGFHVKEIQDVILDEDGITAKIYYDRDLYTVTWKNGDEVVEENTERYEKPLVVPDVAKVNVPAGKNFLGWHTDPASEMPMPFDESSKYTENIAYYAVFADNETKPYVVKYLLQNLDDDNYTEDASARVTTEGIWGLQTQATAKTYTGFTAQPFEQKTIAEDGSTVVEIKYDRNSYTVTWMNGSTKISAATKRYGTVLTAPDAPAAVAGKHFIGWNTDKDAEAAITLPSQYDNDATYYAIFVDNASVHYEVHHMWQNVAGNAYELNEKDNASGIAGIMTTAKAKTYTGFTAQTFEQKTIAEDGSTVVEIKYDRKSYTIKWMKGSTNISTGTLVYGASLTAPDAPAAAAGKHFIGWNTNKSATEAMNIAAITVTANATYYAIFLDNATVDYTVVHKTQKLDGTYEVKAQVTGKGVAGLKTNATANTYEGFTAQKITQAVIAEDGTTTIEVKYNRNSYKLAYENLEDAKIKNSSYTKAGNVKYEAAVVIPVLERTGYSYQWNTIPPATMPSNDVTLTVVWSANTYHDYWDFNDGKGGKVSGETKFGELIRKPDAILSKEGYNFVGWARKETPTVVIENDDFGTMPAKDVNFIAVWKEKDFNYTVKHKFEDLNGAFVENESMRETLTTSYNSVTNATAKNVEGFTAQTIVQKTVEGEGVTIEVNYNRNSYILTWVNTKPESVITNETAYTKIGSIKYGTTIVAPEYSLEGHTYIWSATVPSTMPAGDLTLTTQWDAVAVNYSVVHKFETVDGGTFVEDATMSETLSTKFGTTSDAKAKNVDGFVPNTIDQKIIDANDIVVEVLYRRVSYNLTWVNNSKPEATITNEDAYTKSGSVKYGTAIVAPQYSLEGYTYTWSVDVPSTMPAADFSSSVVFKAIDYTITYNGAENGSISGKTTATYGEKVVVTIAPDENYEIATITPSESVEISEDGMSAVLTMGASDITLNATFKKKVYPITLKTIGPGVLEFIGEEGAGIGESVTIAIKPEIGGKFDAISVTGASYDLSDDESYVVVTVENPTVVVLATFVQQGYKITVEGDDHGTVSVPASAVYNESVKITVAPDAGYELESIAVDGTNLPLNDKNEYSYTMPNADILISVAFKAIEYKITVGEVLNGTLSPMQETAHVGEEVSVQYQADEGYHFINFYVNDEVKALSDDNKFVMPASDVVLTVKFSESGYGIAVKDVEGGTVVPAVYEANAGDVVDLEIKPAAGYEFVSVGVAEGQKATIGNVDKSALTAKLTMAAENATIVPVFKKASFSISLTANDGNEVEVAKTAVFGDKVTVTFAPAKGYRFKEIKSDDVEFAVDAEGKSATFTMPAKDVKGSVSFEKIAYTIVYAESENGTISGPETACYGDKVTVTVTPDKYHILSDIEVSSGEVEMSDDRQSATITMDADNVIVSATFEKHCDYYQYAPSAVLYDWVLLVDKTEFAKLGYDIDDTNVTWYRIVGEQDDPCDDFDVEDDEVAGQGLYLTSETSLLGSGNYYAVIEVDGERFRTKTFFYESNGQNKVMLVPTRASRRQTLRISGLKDVADVMVYDMTGNLVRVLKTDGNETYNIEAEDNSGMYIVRIVSENKEWSIKYLVK